MDLPRLVAHAASYRDAVVQDAVAARLGPWPIAASASAAVEYVDDRWPSARAAAGGVWRRLAAAGVRFDAYRSYLAAFVAEVGAAEWDVAPIGRVVETLPVAAARAVLEAPAAPTWAPWSVAAKEERFTWRVIREATPALALALHATLPDAMARPPHHKSLGKAPENVLARLGSRARTPAAVAAWERLCAYAGVDGRRALAERRRRSRR
jgi:hypothetical protein